MLFVICIIVITPNLKWHHMYILLWKEHQNTDGQQFHQYQQNEEPFLTSNHWTQKRSWHMMWEIWVLDWNSHKLVAGLNQLMGSQPTLLINRYCDAFDIFYFTETRVNFFSQKEPVSLLPQKDKVWFNDFWCFNATFNNISAISWQPVLVVEEAGVPGENHRPWASNW